MDTLEAVEGFKKHSDENCGIAWLPLGIDVDGTLTHDTAYSVQACLDCKPRHHMIKAVNILSHTNLIIIYTARTDEKIPATLWWLRTNGVRFDAISNEKRPFYMIDDKSFNPFQQGNTILKNQTHKAWQILREEADDEAIDEMPYVGWDVFPI